MLNRIQELANRKPKPMTRNRLLWLLGAHAFQLGVVVLAVAVSPLAGASAWQARGIAAVLGLLAIGTTLALLLAVREGRITVAAPSADDAS
jgi:hypothetical protein